MTFVATARSGQLPHFDDLLFLGASISRYPLEGYRERCGTDVVLGARHAKQPIELRIPITIAGMSFGSLSAQAKEALGRGATIAGTSTTTGDGGMTAEEREHSRILVYQISAEPIRHEPRRSAGGGCDRDCHWARRQTRRRRHAAWPEDYRARCCDADAAARDRSAECLPTSRLDGSG